MGNTEKLEQEKEELEKEHTGAWKDRRDRHIIVASTVFGLSFIPLQRPNLQAKELLRVAWVSLVLSVVCGLIVIVLDYAKVRLRLFDVNHQIGHPRSPALAFPSGLLTSTDVLRWLAMAGTVVTFTAGLGFLIGFGNANLRREPEPSE